MKLNASPIPVVPAAALRSAVRIVIAAAALGTSSCAGIPPKAAHPEASAVAITVSMTVHTHLTTWAAFEPERVYFIRLTEGDINDAALKKKEAYYSNYHAATLATKRRFGGPLSFAMNLKAGRYAAVAAVGTAGRHSYEKSVLVLFPREMVTASVITLEPGTISYMGAFELETVSHLSDPKEMDDIQRHYLGLICPSVKAIPRMSRVMSWTPFLHLMPGMMKHDSSPAIHASFREYARGIFRGTAWADRLR